MRDVITHRGPDEAGLFIDRNVGLGHRRLSIVDVASGQQPMTNAEDGTLHITYNGEIYNHADNRESLESRGHVYATHCDTETILHLYEEHGSACVDYLRGMFAFAIWDQRKQELFIARDRHNPRVVQAAGIESPGLTSCLSIGQHVARLVGEVLES